VPQAERRRFDGRAWLVLAGFVALCAAVSALGGLATQSNVKSWYPTLAKPGFNPSDLVFAPVWSALYLIRARRVSRLAAAASLLSSSSLSTVTMSRKHSATQIPQSVL